MNTKSPECWATDPQARGLRIQISTERSMLLPHNEFVFGELLAAGKEQTLRLAFATHEILVRGYSLRRIETAMQRMELSYIAILPSNERSLVADGQPAILGIEVKNSSDLAENSRC